jgi:type IV pilus assembly protein pilP
LDTAPKGGNAPDVNRPKETLEAFSLENMAFVGTLQSGGKVSGFIKVNDHVYTVYPGNYIGQNYGRIQSITEDKIILTEQVEDSYGNWVYRKAELPLSSKEADSSNSSDSSNSN